MMFIFIFRVFNRIRDGAGRQAGRVSFRSRLMQQLKLVEFMWAGVCQVQVESEQQLAAASTMFYCDVQQLKSERSQ